MSLHFQPFKKGLRYKLAGSRPTSIERAFKALSENIITWKKVGCGGGHVTKKLKQADFRHFGAIFLGHHVT